MNRRTFLRGDAALRLYDSEAGGLPVLFQHGLGGDATQVAENFPDGPRYRRLTLECRGHGASRPGGVRPFSLALFAADVFAAADALGIGRFVVGGISMGAAIALAIAVGHPHRVAGVVLARPAWDFTPAPENMRPYAEVAACLRAEAPDAARQRFRASATAAMLAELAPDNLASLLGFFDRPDPALTAALLADIAGDGPGVSEAQAAAIAVPTLVIGHRRDFAHPLTTARRLAEAIPGARLAEITPKATDKPCHIAEFRTAVDDFLATLLPTEQQDRP